MDLKETKLSSESIYQGSFLNNRDYKDGNGNVNRGSRLKQHSYLAKLGYDFNDDHGIRLTYRQEYQKGNRTDKAEGFRQAARNRSIFERFNTKHKGNRNQ